MITISKSKLKAKMLEYFRHVEKSGEEIIVTSNRVPVIKISLLDTKHTPATVFKDNVGNLQYFEDILNDTSDEWEEK